MCRFAGRRTRSASSGRPRERVASLRGPADPGTERGWHRWRTELARRRDRVRARVDPHARVVGRVGNPDSALAEGDRARPVPDWDLRGYDLRGRVDPEHLVQACVADPGRPGVDGDPGQG